MVFKFKEHVIVIPNTEYEIIFEATVNKPCSILCNLYTYNPHYVELDGESVEIKIPSSGEYSIQLSTSRDLNPNNSDTYVRFWNDECDLGDININNVKCDLLGTNSSDKNVISGSRNIVESGILMVTTWDVNCGIATYSKHLTDSIRQNYTDESIKIVSINNGLPLSIEGEIVHFQHEFGIIPQLPRVTGHSVITWHTVPTKPHDEVRRISQMDDVHHIVHADVAKQALMQSGIKYDQITVIPHGSFKFPEPMIYKQAVRELLGLPSDRFIAFIFGFRSINKGYDDILDFNIDNALLLVTGAPNHSENATAMSGNISKWTNTEHVQFLYEFLSELKVTLYALASDAFIFNYPGDKPYISSSGAMHRIIGAGRPIICTDVPQFDELEHNVSALKVNHPGEIEDSIRLLMEDPDLADKLGEYAMVVSEETSWEVVAQQHMDLYSKIRGGD